MKHGKMVSKYSQTCFSLIVLEIVCYVVKEWQQF